MATHVLIPAYQPSAALPQLVGELLAAGVGVVVVDDGSIGCEGTFAQLEGLRGVTLLRHERNQGKGQALKTGLAHLLSVAQPEDIVVTADADGQHLPADILAVAQEAVANPQSLVLGVRQIDQMPGRSRLGNTLMRAGMGLLYGVQVEDTQTGLRAFSLSTAPALLALPEGGYVFETSMLINAAQIFEDGILQVRISTVYEEGNPSSHYNAVFDSARILAAMVRHLPCFLVASFSSFALDYLLFSLLYSLTGLGAVPSTVCARIVSGSYNFCVNKFFTFKNRGVRYTFGRYVLLALGILAINSLLMYALVDVLGLPALAMKIVVECLLYIVSFTVQTRWSKS